MMLFSQLPLVTGLYSQDLARSIYLEKAMLKAYIFVVKKTFCEWFVSEFRPALSKIIKDATIIC